MIKLLRLIPNRLFLPLTAAWLKITGAQYSLSRYGILLSNRFEDATFLRCLTGSYGYYLAEQLTSYNQAFEFVDIGANQGLYTILAAKNKLCSLAIGFEPVTMNFKFLEKNVEINAPYNGLVKLENVAISNKNRAYQMSYDPKNSGSANCRQVQLESRNNQSARTHQQDPFLLETKAIDGNQLATSLNGTRLLIKIDVEGHELEVLQTLATSGLLVHCSDLFIEIDERWINLKLVNTILDEYQFSLLHKEGKTHFHYDCHFRRSLQ